MLESFCELYPEAPIYTLIHKKNSTSPIIESREVITSWLNKIPGIHENYRYFLPLMPFAAMSLKIKHQADLVLSSSHCVIKGVTKPQGAIHISYVHSPMRYIYDQFESYFGTSRFPIRIAAHLMRPFLQTWDYISNANVDHFIANSRFVQQRIKFFYNRDSVVIHPFIDLKDFKAPSRSSIHENYLMVTAFAPNKRVDLAITAFNKLGKELRIIGGGSEQEIAGLKLLAKDNIKFLGSLKRDQVLEEFSRAKALIFPGVEDFGIVPLEALASGTPVIAFKSGGVLDTLNAQTAEFFEEQTPTSLNQAILRNEGRVYQEDLLKERAHQFSKESFLKKITNLITSF